MSLVGPAVLNTFHVQLVTQLITQRHQLRGYERPGRGDRGWNRHTHEDEGTDSGEKLLTQEMLRYCVRQVATYSIFG